MSTVREKSSLILDHEQRFAGTLAVKVLNKPKLNIWMVLIPVLFVFHMYEWQRYKEGRKAFAANYLVTKKRALDEAVAVVEDGRKADPAALTAQSDLPAEARQKLAELYAVLVEHYEDLLRSDGDDFEALVRSTYKSRTNYLLFLNRLHNTEKALNLALKPHLSATTNGVNDIVSTIEHHSEAMRRGAAEAIFA